MDHDGVVCQEFDGLDREVQPEFPGKGLGDVNRGERGVEGKVEAFPVPGLAARQAGELFPITV